MNEISHWEEEIVLVTGGCGSVGTELVKQLLVLPVKKVIVFDHAESLVYHMDQKYRNEPRFDIMVGDIRDLPSLDRAMKNVTIAFHGAALKHVNLGEKTPDEIVSTNIVGVQNIISAAKSNQLKRVVFMSSDKAVNPTNVMGTSKLMGERLFTAAQMNQGREKTIFTSTRFGNVLGSNGSAVTTFMKQIRDGDNITLTDESMTRFVMTPQEAVMLVIYSSQRAIGGEVFVTKMPVMAIKDLIQAIMNLYAPSCNRDAKDIKIEVVGKRPGEKVYEELVSSEETSRVTEIENFFIVHPALEDRFTSSAVPSLNYYRSDQENLMTTSEIEDYLIKFEVLESAQI
jgi:FlaA1/EpsC-like NDP-sugar epimerase